MNIFSTPKSLKLYGIVLWNLIGGYILPKECSGGSRGGSEVLLEPPTPTPQPFLNIIWKWNNLVSVSETKLFHFHGISKKNVIKQQSEPHIFIHMNSPFQISWIRPWNVSHIIKTTLSASNLGIVCPWLNSIPDAISLITKSFCWRCPIPLFHTIPSDYNIRAYYCQLKTHKGRPLSALSSQPFLYIQSTSDTKVCDGPGKKHPAELYIKIS